MLAISKATFGVLLIILSTMIFSSDRAVAADKIKIAVLDNFSGAFEYTGRMYFGAVEFAVNEQNKKGGLFGKQIEVLKEDAEMKPDIAVRKAKKLMLEDKVNFIAVTYSHLAIAVSKAVGTYKNSILVVNAAVADQITGKEFNEHMFRIMFTAHSLNSALAQYMATKPYRKYYILCQDYAAGHDYAETFKKELKVHLPGAKIVGEDYHPIGHKDYAPYITKVQAAGADAVYSGSYGQDLINMIRQARSLGLKQPFPFVAPYAMDPILVKELGEDAVGSYCAWNYELQINSPENQAMIKAYYAMHKDDKEIATVWPAYGIGHVISGWKMIFAAAEKAGSVEPAKFIPAFEGFEYNTPAGLWKMRKCDHQAISPIYCGVITSAKNPYYSFPWVGRDLFVVPGEKCAIPATKDYNPRCP